MSFSFLQILLLLLIVFTFSRTVLRAKEGKVMLGEFIFWFSLWASGLILVIWPNTATIVADKIGVGRGADAVIYTSLVILFYLLFRTHVELENLRHEITKLVQEIALRSQEKIPRSKKRK